MITKLGLLLLTFVFLACSKVSVGYSLGTHQIQNRVEDAFDFSGSKSKEVNRFLSEEFDKNKKPVFKKLKDVLVKMEALSQKESPTQVEKDQLHQFLLDFQKELIVSFKSSFDKVIKEVGDAEIKNFKEYSADQIAEKREEALDKKSFKKKKIANFTRVAEFLLGDLTSEQEQQVAKFVDEHVDFYIQQIELRSGFSADFVKLFPQKDKMIDLSLAYFSGDQSVRSEDYKKARGAFELDMKNLIFSLWAQKTAEQKKFFQKRVQDISSEIDKILSE